MLSGFENFHRRLNHVNSRLGASLERFLLKSTEQSQIGTGKEGRKKNKGLTLSLQVILPASQPSRKGEKNV